MALVQEVNAPKALLYDVDILCRAAEFAVKIENYRIVLVPFQNYEFST